MPTFTPPIVEDMPSVLPETTGIQYRLFRHFGPHRRGRSVVLRNGTYVTVDGPLMEETETLEQGVEYFIGGHVYRVSEAVAAALAADGFDVEGLGTWESHSGETWGSLSGSHWEDM